MVSHSGLNLKSNLDLGNPGWCPWKSNEIQYFGGKSSVVHFKQERPHTATEPFSFSRQPNTIWFPFKVPNPINSTLATDFSGTDTANKYWAVTKCQKATTKSRGLIASLGCLGLEVTKCSLRFQEDLFSWCAISRLAAMWEAYTKSKLILWPEICTTYISMIKKNPNQATFTRYFYIRKKKR